MLQGQQRIGAQHPTAMAGDLGRHRLVAAAGSGCEESSCEHTPPCADHLRMDRNLLAPRTVQPPLNARAGATLCRGSGW